MFRHYYVNFYYNIPEISLLYDALHGSNPADINWFQSHTGKETFLQLSYLSILLDDLINESYQELFKFYTKTFTL